MLISMIGRRQHSYSARNPPPTIEYAMAGGGAGSYGAWGGGGGAGELLTDTNYSITPLAVYYMMIGGGGFGEGNPSGIYNYSTGSWEVYIRGGKQGTSYGYTGTSSNASRYGYYGCGGGGAMAPYYNAPASLGRPPGVQHFGLTPSPLVSSGNTNPRASWGRNGDSPTTMNLAGGGGGASLKGTTTQITSPDGVDGEDIAGIHGTSLYLCGGGGGAGYNTNGGAGGNGGGGRANYGQYSSNGTNGTANTGGGGSGNGQYGGSGVIVLAYPNTYDKISWCSSYSALNLSTTSRAGYYVYTILGTVNLTF